MLQSYDWRYLATIIISGRRFLSSNKEKSKNARFLDNNMVHGNITTTHRQ